MQAGTDKMHLLQQLSSRTRRFSILPNDSRWKETQDGNDVLRWRKVSQGRHDFFPGLLGLVSSTQGTDQFGDSERAGRRRLSRANRVGRRDRQRVSLSHTFALGAGEPQLVAGWRHCCRQIKRRHRHREPFPAGQSADRDKSRVGPAIFLFDHHGPFASAGRVVIWCIVRKTEKGSNALRQMVYLWDLYRVRPHCRPVPPRVHSSCTIQKELTCF